MLCPHCFSPAIDYFCYKKEVMNYTEDYNILSAQYHTDKDSRLLEDDILITNRSFTSSFSNVLPSHPATSNADERFSLLPDDEIQENRRFCYPIVKKRTASDDSHVIILLHGLNERSWDKYLPWAKALSLQTNHPVILFPISFHMNRAPKIWSDARVMSLLAKQRRRTNPDIKESTFVNAAISERLQQYPQRFYLSGLETYFDLKQLIDQIQTQTHPDIAEKKPIIDFFGYSIGALLAEIMLMTNPGAKLSQSKAFLFCGGTTLDKMNGISRFILDSKAFEAIRDFFLTPNFQINLAEPLLKKIKKLNIGVSFSSMMNSLNLIDFRNNALFELKNRMQLCPLIKDKVIPAESVLETFSHSGIDSKELVHPVDFPYAYSHESPFPILKDPAPVNDAFRMVFKKASEFLK